jgi:hypothetical protein
MTMLNLFRDENQFRLQISREPNGDSRQYQGLLDHALHHYGGIRWLTQLTLFSPRARTERRMLEADTGATRLTEKLHLTA